MKLKKNGETVRNSRFQLFCFIFFAHTIKEFYFVFIVKKPKGSLTSKGKYVLKNVIIHGEMVILKKT